MPILKAISGHTNCQKVKTYLEKRNRALARDFFNLSWDEREMEGYEESGKDAVEWADEMDYTRAQNGNDRPHEGRKARTYKHFILSPDPDDSIDLPALRELAGAWAMRFFGDYQVAVVYHDDNESHIPHAHIVVNCTNLITGNRLHTDNPFELNRALQDMARERGLRGLSNEMKQDAAKKLVIAPEKASVPRSAQETYMSRAEAEIRDSGQYSWVADIRNRVTIAKGLARNEGEFRQILKTLDIAIADNSAKATHSDWIFSLADDPHCKVTGGRLGFVYSKDSLENMFENKTSYRLDKTPSREVLKAAKNAVVLNDLSELDRMAAAIETCARYGIKSQAECLTYIRAIEARAERSGSSASNQKALAALNDAYSYVTEHSLLPKNAPASSQKKPTTAHRDSAERRVKQERPKPRGKERDGQDKGAR